MRALLIVFLSLLLMACETTPGSTRAASRTDVSSAPTKLAATPEFGVPYLNDRGESWNDGYLWLKGKWVDAASGKQFGDQVDAIDFTCQRQIGMCIEAVASISMGLLNARTTVYDIALWGPRVIRLRPSHEG